MNVCVWMVKRDRTYAVVLSRNTWMAEARGRNGEWPSSNLASLLHCEDEARQVGGGSRETRQKRPNEVEAMEQG